MQSARNILPTSFGKIVNKDVGLCAPEGNEYDMTMENGYMISVRTKREAN